MIIAMKCHVTASTFQQNIDNHKSTMEALGLKIDKTQVKLVDSVINEYI